MGVPVFTAEHTKGVCQIMFEISDEMTNSDGRMSIGSLARQMQRITEIHFDQEAGLTGEELLAKGMSWCSLHRMFFRQIFLAFPCIRRRQDSLCIIRGR